MKKMKMMMLLATLGLTGLFFTATHVNAASCNGVTINNKCIKYCSNNTNAEMQDILQKGVAVSADAYGTKNYQYNYKFFIGGNSNKNAEYYLYFNGKYYCKNNKSKYCNIKYTSENKDKTIYYFKTAGNCYIGHTKFKNVVSGSNVCPKRTDKDALSQANVEANAKLSKNYDEGTFTVRYKHVDGYEVKVKKYNKNTETWDVVSGCGQSSCNLGSQVGSGTVSYRIIYYVNDKNNTCNNQPVMQIRFEDVPKFKLNPYIKKGACNGYNNLNNALQGVISKCKHKYVTNDATNPSQQQLKKIEKLMEKAKDLNKDLGDFSEYGNSELKKYIDNPSLLDTKRPSIATQYCKFNKDKNIINKKTYTTEVGLSKGAAKYFKMVCQESISGNYDTPKLVSNNGGGFSYDVNLNHDVSCYLTFKNKDVLEELLDLEECDYSAYATGDPDGTNTANGTLGAGPTEEFDACINECDGGKYTQSCINSCGAKEKDKKTQLNFTSTVFTNSNIKKMASSPPPGAERWTKEWCYYGPYHATKSDGSKYINEGHMRCIYSASSGGKIIGKMYTTDHCTATKEITITNPGSGKRISAVITDWRDNSTQLYTTGISVNDKGYVSGADCYVTDTDKLIEKELNSIAKAFDQAKDDYEKYVGNTKLDTSKIDATYTIHDSTEAYCDNDKSKDIVYKTTSNKNPLIVNPVSKTENSGHSVPRSLKDLKTTTLSFGFPNTCLKNGTYKNKKGCCNPSDGMTGGKKFYMAVTTEKDINNVYSWPTTTNANFTKKEKETIDAIRADINNRISGEVIPWDANTVSRVDKEKNSKFPKEKCDKNGYKFKYNIKTNFKNIGVLGNENDRWNIDINCFYGYYDPNIGSCGVESKDLDTDGDGELDTTMIKETLCDPKDQPDGANKQVTTLVNDYIFRTVDVTDLFNGTDQAGRPWNWKTSKTTNAATNLLNARKISYKINPDTTVNNIQTTGYAYTDYRNFQFNISNANMRNIRKYNTDHPNIASTSCNNKKMGCSNTFITNNSYRTTASGDFGVTYNNKRDNK